MNISDKLHFVNVGDSFAIKVNCNNCDRQDLPHGWQIAVIFPFNDKTEFIYIVCSDECRQAFLSHKDLDILVMLDIVQAAQDQDKKLSPEFKTILLQISN